VVLAKCPSKHFDFEHVTLLTPLVAWSSVGQRTLSLCMPAVLSVDAAQQCALWV